MQAVLSPRQDQRIAATAVPAPIRALNTPSSTTSRFSLPKRQAWKVTPASKMAVSVNDLRQELGFKTEFALRAQLLEDADVSGTDGDDGRLTRLRGQRPVSGWAPAPAMAAAPTPSATPSTTAG